jgi:hypothetical protein
MADYLTDEQFGALFREFKHTAFRLELRESYAGVSYEREPMARFLAGQPVGWGEDTTWLGNVVAATVEGRRFSRVRVVSEPWSDYTRYGLAMAAYTVAAGEDIRYLPRHDAPELGGDDYWLFDGDHLVICHYGTDNDRMSAEVITDPHRVVRANALRETAWHHATPYRSYVESRRVAASPSGP